MSNLKFDFSQSIIKDIYLNPLSMNDIRVTTATLLSARFPYFSSAGTLKDTATGNIMGFVDGGYYDNSGGNTAYEILINIKHNYPDIWNDICPVIIYISNGGGTEDKIGRQQAFMYQLLAPLETYFQTMDSHTLEAESRVKEFAEYNDGEFIKYTLNVKVDSGKKSKKIIIPLGWSLSELARNEINEQLNESNLNKVLDLLP